MCVVSLPMSMKIEANRLNKIKLSIKIMNINELLVKKSYLEAFLLIHQMLEIMLQILLYHYKRGVHGRKHIDEVKWNLIADLSFSKLINAFEEFEETKKEIPIHKLREFNTFRNNLVHQSILNAKISDAFEIDKYITIGLDVANKLIKSHPSSLKDFA